MLHINTIRKVEFEVFFAIIAVATLNIIIFSLLATNPVSHTVFIDDILQTTIVYGTSIVAMLFLILKQKRNLVKYVFYLLLSLITGKVLLNLYALIFDKRISDNGTAILIDAFLIWIVSLLAFSLWYWIIDRGGPIARATESHETRYDLLFPQYQGHIPGWEHWTPKFLDYIFFSFFTSTGFSPADTLPLTKRVKMLMMLEASISLIIIGMVASRAISLLQ